MSKTLKPYDYKINGLDNDDEKIVKIYSKHLEYVVYRTNRAIRVDFDDESPNLSTHSNNHYKIGIDLARIYSWLPENLSKSEPVNRQIARAMTTNIAGNYDDAVKMLEHAENRIIKLKTIQGRLHYTLSAFLLVFLSFIITLFNSKTGFGVFSYIALCGSLGGALSIAIGFSTLEIDLDANLLTNCLIGGSRILIAIAAAIFSYFAIHTDVTFSFVKNAPTNYGVYMVAMVAGFAEMFIPNIMNNLAKENSTSNRKEESTNSTSNITN